MGDYHSYLHPLLLPYMIVFFFFQTCREKINKAITYFLTLSGQLAKLFLGDSRRSVDK